MKKTLKVLGLLAVAAALFIGCKNNADEGSGEKNISEPLFNVEDLTEDADTIETEDGEWTFRKTSSGDRAGYGKEENSEELVFVIKNGAIDHNADFKYIFCSKITTTEPLSEADKAMAKKMGYTDIGTNTATYYKEIDAAKMKELMKKYSADEEYFDEYAWAFSECMHTMGNAEWYLHDTHDDMKRNADKTKYYFEYSDKDEGLVKCYLSKN